MSDHASQARELLAAAQQLEHGRTRFTHAEEAVRYADLAGDRALQFEARDELVYAATFNGRPERALAAFAWVLANCEEHQWSSNAIWCGFVWTAEDAPHVASISRDELEHIFAQMEDLFMRNNWWTYPVWIARFRAGIAFGEEPDGMREWLRKFEDELAAAKNSSPHYRHVRAGAWLRLGEPEAAMRWLRPNFEDADADEPEYPHRSHAMASLALAQLGNLDEARMHYRRAKELCRENQVFLREVGRLLVFASEDNHVADVVDLVERHLIWAVESWDHWSSMLWFIAAARALDHVPRIRLLPKLPAKITTFGGGEPIEASELAARCWDEAMRLAAAFDERNGNDTWCGTARRIREGQSASVLFQRATVF